jgi:hypothetical protein
MSPVWMIFLIELAEALDGHCHVLRIVCCFSIVVYNLRYRSWNERTLLTNS